MIQGSYVSEDTNSLIRRAQQTMGEVPVLDLTNWQNPTYMSGTEQIRSLAGSCYSIKVKNSITGISFSIATCTSGVNTGCTVPASCPAGPLTPSDWVNMVVTFTAAAAQPTGVTITFQYVLNGVPTTTVLSPPIVSGSNTFYAFAAPVQYVPDTELVLYGVDIQT